MDLNYAGKLQDEKLPLNVCLYKYMYMFKYLAIVVRFSNFDVIHIARPFITMNNTGIPISTRYLMLALTIMNNKCRIFIY